MTSYKLFRGMKMEANTIDLKPQYLLDDQGNPKSVLLEYKVFRELMEIIEDLQCEEVINERLKEVDLEFPEVVD